MASRGRHGPRPRKIDTGTSSIGNRSQCDAVHRILQSNCFSKSSHTDDPWVRCLGEFRPAHGPRTFAALGQFTRHMWPPVARGPFIGFLRARISTGGRRTPSEKARAAIRISRPPLGTLAGQVEAAVRRRPVESGLAHCVSDVVRSNYQSEGVSLSLPRNALANSISGDQGKRNCNRLGGCHRDYIKT